MKHVGPFLAVLAIVSLVTVVVGIALQRQPDWHFTILDVVLDFGAGLSFGVLLVAILSFRRKGVEVGFLPQTALIILLSVAGVLAVLVIEGGAARALIFGS